MLEGLAGHAQGLARIIAASSKPRRVPSAAAAVSVPVVRATPPAPDI